MFRMTSCLAAPAIVLLMGGTAHAALTADQVWQSWKDGGALIGLEVTAATENSDGGTLTLNGVSIAPAGMPGVTISDVVMTEASDGSVTIVPGADIKLGLSGDTKGTAGVQHEGLTLTAREADGGLAYDYAATKLDIVYDTTAPGVSFDGSPAADVASKGTVSLGELSGTYSDTPGTNRSFGLDMTVGLLAYATSIDDPSLELKQESTSETTGITVSFDLALPSSMSAEGGTMPTDFGVAIQEGLSVSFASTQGATTGTVKQESPYMPMDLKITAGGGESSGVFNKEKVSIKSSGSGLEVESTSAMMPAPIKLTMGAVEFEMTSPIVAAETAGDFALVMKLNQLSVNEEAWAMVDPTGALPHDPADLAINISGKTLIDVPAMIAADSAGGMPVVPTPESLNITELTAKVAGAALAGTGAFTFDNSMGFPMPIGEANVSLTGGNALIDGLIAMGIVTEEDAMGARMMMGAFMSPGAGPDELTSKIEAKPGFEIYVNGQRVQ
jgi:hypothetical protein